MSYRDREMECAEFVLGTLGLAQQLPAPAVVQGSGI